MYSMCFELSDLLSSQLLYKLHQYCFHNEARRKAKFNFEFPAVFLFKVQQDDSLLFYDTSSDDNIVQSAI